MDIRKTSYNELTYQQAVDEARRLLSKADLPLPDKPEGYGTTYSFPGDPSKVTGIELSKLTFQLAAWRGRAAWLAGVIEAELQVLDAVFDVIKGTEMTNVERELRDLGVNRPVKEQIYSAAISGSAVLQQLQRKSMEKRSFLTLVRTQKDIYEQQIWILNDERRRQGWEHRNDREMTR